MVRPPVSFGIQLGLVNTGRYLRLAVGGNRHGGQWRRLWPPLRHRMTFYAGAVCVGLMAVAVVACGGSADETPSSTVRATSIPTPTPTPVNPAAVLLESGRTMQVLESFHFRLDHQEGYTSLMNLALSEAEGDIVKPDKMSVDLIGGSAGFLIKSGLIVLGDDSFMINPLAGKWEALPKEASPLGFFDPQEGIVSMMAAVEAPVLTSFDGRVYTIEGHLPADALSPLIGPTLDGATVSVEVAISVAGYYLERVVFVGAAKEGEIEGTIRTIKLSRFDEPVTIEAPQ